MDKGELDLIRVPFYSGGGVCVWEFELTLVCLCSGNFGAVKKQHKLLKLVFGKDNLHWFGIVGFVVDLTQLTRSVK